MTNLVKRLFFSQVKSIRNVALDNLLPRAYAFTFDLQLYFAILTKRDQNLNEDLSRSK